MNSGPDGGAGRRRLPHGKPVTVETGIGRFALDAATPPADPGTPAGS
ncbi:hypothetical protein ACQPZG_14970 [Streptomyces sp. CA-294286]